MSDWAGVLEVWTWTYYSAEANTEIGRRMHQNTHFETEKWKYFLGRVQCSSKIPPQWEGDTPSPYFTPCPLDPRGSSILALDLLPPRPKHESWIRP